jgi:serine protease Do
MDLKHRANTSPGGRRPLRLAAIGLSSAAAISLLVGMNAVQATNQNPAATPQSVAPQTGAAQSGAVWTGYADLAERVMPSVVGITASRAAEETPAQGRQREFRGPEGFGGPGAEEFRRFMERFFGEEFGERFGEEFGDRPFPGQPMPPRGFEFGPPTAVGSGFIVDESGLIVTNNHVVANAGTVTVKLNDGTELEADVVGRDPDTDLALLKVETDQPLQAVRFADSDRVRVGDPVVAIGSPFGLGGTVTAGIVSAKERTIGAGRYDDFLQIDAPINRGNSGGPAFNLEGEVIGVNSAISSPTGGNVGIGFAIPANLAQSIIDDLEDDGQVERGWLGVHIQGIDEDLAQSFGLDEPKGALVSQVMPDSPAASAEFQKGDVILEFDGTGIEQLRDLTRAVAETDPGSNAKAVVWRDGQEVTLDVEIGLMPSDDQVAMADPRGATDQDAPQLGLALAPLTPDARESLDLPGDVQGVVVADVAPGSPAAGKGLRQGDVIVEAGRQQVSAPAGVTKAVREAAERGDESILLLVKRDGQDRFVAVPIERA